jgi:hypothetical protein
MRANGDVFVLFNSLSFLGKKQKFFAVKKMTRELKRTNTSPLAHANHACPTILLTI